MHVLFLLVAMLFVASTPFMSIPEGRDVEISDNAERDSGSSDDNSGADVLPVQDADGAEERDNA